MATTFTITDSLEEPILFDNTYATRYEIEVDVWPFGTSDDYFDGAVVTYYAKDGTQLATTSYDKSESDLAYADFPWLLDRVYQEGLESLQEVADDRRSGWHNYEGLTDE